MTIAAVTDKQLRALYNKTYNTTVLAAINGLIAAVNAGAQVVNSISADTDGRAMMQDGYFTEAQATAKFAAQAIVGSIIKNATITVTQLAGDAVETAKIKDANVTQAKLAVASLDATVVKVAAAGNTLGAIPVTHAIAVADGSTVLDALTLNATYGKLTITDAWFQKNTVTGGTTDAVQLCTDAGGATAVTASMALNAVASGGIVRATTVITANAVFAAGAHLYVKRTHTTDCGGTLHIIGYRTA